MVSWEHIYEVVLAPVVRHRIRDDAQVARFESVRADYNDVLAKLRNGSPEGVAESAGDYTWEEWAASLADSFSTTVPFDFLNHPFLRHSMVYSRRRGVRATRSNLSKALEAFSKPEVATLVREDCVGSPVITDAHYLTSAHRSYHAAHLAAYTKHRGSRVWDAETIVEWGGGYGNMARIVRKLNPHLTYIIVDLPELLALQFVYLSSVEDKDAVNVVDESGDIARGRINLVPTARVRSGEVQLHCDVFLSTWALTESPPADQHRVMNNSFFGADRLLLGLHNDGNNHLGSSLTDDVLKLPLDTKFGIGSGNEYWFR